jgi:hypothetical protein
MLMPRKGDLAFFFFLSNSATIVAQVNGNYPEYYKNGV